jgi:hypothetical protein
MNNTTDSLDHHASFESLILSLFLFFEKELADRGVKLSEKQDHLFVKTRNFINPTCFKLGPSRKILNICLHETEERQIVIDYYPVFSNTENKRPVVAYFIASAQFGPNREIPSEIFERKLLKEEPVILDMMAKFLKGEVATTTVAQKDFVDSFNQLIAGFAVS